VVVVDVVVVVIVVVVLVDVVVLLVVVVVAEVVEVLVLVVEFVVVIVVVVVVETVVVFVLVVELVIVAVTVVDVVFVVVAVAVVVEMVLVPFVEDVLVSAMVGSPDANLRTSKSLRSALTSLIGGCHVTGPLISPLSKSLSSKYMSVTLEKVSSIRICAGVVCSSNDDRAYMTTCVYMLRRGVFTGTNVCVVSALKFLAINDRPEPAASLAR
jgi:hypothetical protein